MLRAFFLALLIALLPASACLMSDDGGDDKTDQALGEGKREGTGGEPGDDGEPVCDSEDTSGVCIDCACDCGGGQYRAYGGCFGPCDDIPPGVASCTVDCSTVCEGL